MRKGIVFGVLTSGALSSRLQIREFQNVVWIGMLALWVCTAQAQPAPTAWVVNSLGETLSEVNLSTGQVVTNSVTLGSMPNDIAIRENLAYVVNSGLNQVQIIDLLSRETTGTIEIYLGLNPYSIALDDQNRAFVTNYLTGNVSVLDLQAGTESEALQIGGVPVGVCVTQEYLFVTDINYQMPSWGPGRLYAFSLQTLNFLDSTTVGINPQVVKLGPDGNLHVICTGNYDDVAGQVDIVDPQTLTVNQSILIGGTPGSLAFTSNDIAYLGSGGWMEDGYVYSYNAQTYQVVHGEQNPITVPTGAMGVAVTQSDQVLVCCFMTDQLAELDAEGNLVGTFLVGDSPVTVGIQEPPPAVGPSSRRNIKYSLTHNFPDPFNASTTIIYALEVPKPVMFEVFDPSGRLIERHFLGDKPAGVNRTTFTPPISLNSGVYYYRFLTGSSRIYGSMLFLK